MCFKYIDNDSTLFPLRVDHAISTEGNDAKAWLHLFSSLVTFALFSRHVGWLKVRVFQRWLGDVSFARVSRLYCFRLFSHTTILNIIVVTRREISIFVVKSTDVRRHTAKSTLSSNMFGNCIASSYQYPVRATLKGNLFYLMVNILQTRLDSILSITRNDYLVN